MRTMAPRLSRNRQRRMAMAPRVCSTGGRWCLGPVAQEGDGTKGHHKLEVQEGNGVKDWQK